METDYSQTKFSDAGKRNPHTRFTWASLGPRSGKNWRDNGIWYTLWPTV
jgi:hypothetical protein